MKKIIFSVFAFLMFLQLQAETKKVLFIGNSYTGQNNLPNLVAECAGSVGDTLIHDRRTPGGYRFLNHADDTNTMNKINSNDWDYVSLQAQSQEPSFPLSQVESEVFPYASRLCDSIRANNACTRPVFFMTWGRESGDAGNCAVWPPVCTYEGMDSLLNLRYRIMGNDNEAYVSPVGAVWHYLRDNHPDIDLYSGDGSHPSQVGSYAAAVTFYTIFFQKDPTLITYDYSVEATQAAIIREAVKTLVYEDFAEWNVGTYDPIVDFSYTGMGNMSPDVVFEAYPTTADSVYWDLGDGNTADSFNFTHTYEADGVYEVTGIVYFECYDAVQFSLNVTVDYYTPIFSQKVWLQGFYQGDGLMNTNLVEANLLPTNQPFDRPPWNYGGDEMISDVSADITDWVLIECRLTSDLAVVVQRRAALLRNNGDLIDVDAGLVAGVRLANTEFGEDYTIIVRARNHLAVSSQNFTFNAAGIDTDNMSDWVIGDNQLYEHEDGFYSMFAGDFDSSGLITVDDFNTYLLDASATNQYIDADLNGDGVVSIEDFNLYQQNSSLIGLNIVRY